MIKSIDGKLYMEMPYDAADAMMLEFLQDGRSGVSESIDDTIRRVAENGLGRHHMEDIADNTKYLNAFDLLIHYYGG